MEYIWTVTSKYINLHAQLQWYRIYNDNQIHLTGCCNLDTHSCTRTKHQTPNTNTLQNKHTNTTCTKAHKLTTHETADTLHRFYKYKNIIISQNIPRRRRLNWQQEIDNLFKGKRETRDLLFTMQYVFLICFYNKNSTKTLISLHSLHHKVPTDHVVDQ